jgi:hypothetical protein
VPVLQVANVEKSLRWIAGTAILDVAAAAGKNAGLLRGPERMVYGLVELSREE